MTQAQLSRWFDSLSGLEIVAFGACFLLYSFVGLILTNRWLDNVLSDREGLNGGPGMADGDGCVIVPVVIISYIVGATVWPLTWSLVWLWRFAMLLVRLGK